MSTHLDLSHVCEAHVCDALCRWVTEAQGAKGGGTHDATDMARVLLHLQACAALGLPAALLAATATPASICILLLLVLLLLGSVHLLLLLQGQNDAGREQCSKAWR